jgi:hypothetical protein
MMWLPGHVAVALLICLPLMWLYRAKRDSYLLPLTFIAFFSVLPDFMHFDTGLRTFSHSLIGATVLAVCLLVILWKAFGTGWLLNLIAMVAVYAHLLGDMYIGHIYPYYPFSMEIVQNNQFNTVYDLRFEVLILTVAAVVVIALYALDRKGFRLEPLTLTELRILLTLLLPFGALCLAQTGYFGIQDIILNPTWSAVILGMFFLLLLALTSLWAIRIFRALQKGNGDPSKGSKHYPL